MSCPTAKEAADLVFLRVDGMSVLTFTGTGADSADHGRSGLDGMSVLTFPGTGLDSADHGRSGLNGMSVLTCLGPADSADHGRSGVDGISLPTFLVTGAESLVHAYFGDDGISLPKYVYADATYHLFGVYSLISSSSPYFFPNLPLHQGVVYIIRLILVRYGTDTGARKYCRQLLCTIL